MDVIDPWRGIKMQKSLCFHVCVNKKWLVRHVITLRTLLDAHGPKEVSESKQYDLTTHRKFFHASQSQRLHSLTCNICTILLFFRGKNNKIVQKSHISEWRRWLWEAWKIFCASLDHTVCFWRLLWDHAHSTKYAGWSHGAPILF